MPDSGPSGFQIEYPAITLHAISRGESGPSIYCQLDETLDDAGGSAGDEGDEGNAQMRELIIVPEQPKSRTFDNNLLVQSHPLLFSRDDIRSSFAMRISSS
jgi:hypothetical protein